MAATKKASTASKEMRDPKASKEEKSKAASELSKTKKAPAKKK